MTGLDTESIWSKRPRGDVRDGVRTYGCRSRDGSRERCCGSLSFGFGKKEMPLRYHRTDKSEAVMAHRDLPTTF